MEMPIGNVQLYNYLLTCGLSSTRFSQAGSSRVEHSTLGEYGVRVSSLEFNLQLRHVEDNLAM